MVKATIGVLCVLLMAAMAQANLIDNFDTYADQAAFDAAYTQIYPTVPLVLDQTKGHSDSQSANTAGPNNNSEKRVYRNLGGEYSGTDAAPLKFEFYMSMSAADDWWTREYIEIRGYTGAGYGDGDLQELIALGCTSSGVDTTVYNARILTGDLWVNTTTAKSTDWTKLTALIKSSTVEVYVNDNLDYSGPRSTGVTLDSVVIGSGLSSNVDVWFDDLQVIPEPATMSLLGMAGVALLLRRRR